MTMEGCYARVPVGILENPPQRLQVVRPTVGSNNEWDAAVLVGLVVMSILMEFLSFGLFARYCSVFLHRDQKGLLPDFSLALHLC